MKTGEGNGLSMPLRFIWNCTLRKWIGINKFFFPVSHTYSVFTFSVKMSNVGHCFEYLLAIKKRKQGKGKKKEQQNIIKFIPCLWITASTYWILIFS